MKTAIYTISTGAILAWEDEGVEMTGLATDVSYLKSETALGTETNISQLPSDIMRPRRIICGDKISGATKTALDDATTVGDLKAFLQIVMFGD